MTSNKVTCYTLTMAEFIPWYLEETPRPEFWEDLYSEYISLRENRSSAYVSLMVREIAVLKTKYQMVETMCNLMVQCFTHMLIDQHKQLKDELRKFNHRYQYNLANELHFSRDIRATLSANKKLISTWQRKETELEKYHERHNGRAIQRKDFYMMAVAFSEFQKHRVDLEVIKVAEWCMIYNQYEKYCEVKNAELKGKKYGRS